MGYNYIKRSKKMSNYNEVQQSDLERSRPFLQIPLPPPEYLEYLEKKGAEKQEDSPDEERGVIIIEL